MSPSVDEMAIRYGDVTAKIVEKTDQAERLYSKLRVDRELYERLLDDIIKLEAEQDRLGRILHPA